MWTADLRLVADIELFRQQFNEAKLDNNVSICAFLRVASVRVGKVSGEVNLDGLDSGAGHRDSEILTRLGWIGRHDYRIYLNRVRFQTCLPVSRLFG